MSALNFLEKSSDRFSASLSRLIDAKDVMLNPVDLYIKINIESATNIVELIDSNTLKKRGTCSYDSNGRLNQNRAIIFDEVFAGYATHANANKEGDVVYDDAPVAALYNADIIVDQDGREALRLNLSSLFNVGTPQSPNENNLKLKNFRYLVDEENVSVRLEFAANAAMPAAATANQYFFFKISGFETSRREKK